VGFSGGKQDVPDTDVGDIVGVNGPIVRGPKVPFRGKQDVLNHKGRLMVA